VQASLPGLAELDRPAVGTGAADVRRIYLEHGAFLWRALHGLGVPEADLEDVLQEVLIVVHRRAASFDPERSKLTTWLFGICLRVARGQERRGPGWRDARCDAMPDRAGEETPETELCRRDAERRLAKILDGLSAEKRVTFVMFELEGLSCEQIAELMGVPLGTVHSRIHSARAHFKRALHEDGGSR
jgi:RNA polymerase sigma-70 factor (ECF subfamily)